VNPLYERKVYNMRSKSRDRSPIHAFILLEIVAKKSMVCLVSGSLVLHARPSSVNDDI